MPSKLVNKTTGSRRDDQRERLYRWERDAPLLKPFWKATLSLEACADLAARASDLFGLLPPKIGDGRGRLHACESNGTLKLPKWARSEAVVIHEAAHYVTGHVYGQGSAWHGPEFVAVYLAMLARLLGLDFDALKRSAFDADLYVRTARVIEPVTEREARRLARVRVAWSKAKASEAKRLDRKKATHRTYHRAKIGAKGSGNVVKSRKRYVESDARYEEALLRSATARKAYDEVRRPLSRRIGER